MKRVVTAGNGYNIHRDVLGCPGNRPLNGYNVTPEYCVKLRNLLETNPELLCLVEIILGRDTTKEIVEDVSAA